MRRFGKWLSDNRGVAAVEFAILIPVFLFAFLGANYMASMSVANRKLQQASYALSNMAPYPRDYCTYRDYTVSAYVSGYQKQVVSEILAPFTTADQPNLVRYEEDPPSGGLVASRVRMIYDFRVNNDEHSIYQALDHLRGIAPGVFRMGAISSDTVMSYDGSPCPSDTPLTIAGPTAAEFSVGQMQSVAFSGSGGVPTYTWALLSSLPLGLSMNTGGAVISGVAVDTCAALPCDPVTTNVTIRATDSTDLLWYAKSKQTVLHNIAITVIFELTLSAVNETGTATIPFVGHAPVRRGGKPGFSYGATNLPPGLVINASTGIVSGTPTQPGTFNSTIQIMDARGVTASVAVQYVFAPPPFSMTVERPTISGVVGSPITPNPITVSGGYGAITMNCAGFPAGLHCGYGPYWAIQGTPTTPGSGTMYVTGTDGAGQSVTYPVTYSIVPTPITASAIHLSGQVGAGVTASVTASGGWGAYTTTCWGLPGGMSCAGLTVTGTLTGPPGTGTGGMRITDQWGQTTDVAITWSVASPPVTVSYYPGCTMPTQYGQYGCSYFYASGGYGPLHIASVSGMPPGFSAGGGPNLFYISGTAATIGAGTMYVTIYDNYGSGAVYALGWSFAAPPLYVSYVAENVVQCVYYDSCVFRHYYVPSGGSGVYRAYTENGGGAILYNSVYGDSYVGSYGYYGSTAGYDGGWIFVQWREPDTCGGCARIITSLTWAVDSFGQVASTTSTMYPQNWRW